MSPNVKCWVYKGKSKKPFQSCIIPIDMRLHILQSIMCVEHEMASTYSLPHQPHIHDSASSVSLLQARREEGFLVLLPCKYRVHNIYKHVFANAMLNDLFSSLLKNSVNCLLQEWFTCSSMLPMKPLVLV